MTKKLVEILGVSFNHITRLQLIENLNQCIRQEEKRFVVTANPEIVMMANQNEEYMENIKQADYVTADGIGIVMAANQLKTPLPERVSGFDIMVDLLQLANENNYKAYFLGATEETLHKTIYNIERDYTDIEIVGFQHGFFDWSDPQVTNHIIEAEPDIVFVALGAPRQEKWIGQHLELFNKGIFIGVGGSFDVIAGTVKRAPAIWQKMNLEWLYRIIKQPSRIKRSFAIPQFMMRVLKEKSKGTNK